MLCKGVLDEGKVALLATIIGVATCLVENVPLQAFDALFASIKT